jgi:integrase
VTWKIKYRDVAGRQVKETLGSVQDGWNRRKAEAELRARLTDVKRDGLRKLDPIRFESFAREWLVTYPAAKGLKRSTTESYTSIIEQHLVPAFGRVKLDALDPRGVEEYVAAKRLAGFAARSINRHLNLLHKILATAPRRGLVRANAVALVDRPREPRRRWTILTPPEIGRVERAFDELIREADGDERAWREQARVVFITVLGTGIRRGEALGLRWRDVQLADPDGATLRVRETVVRGHQDTPKSDAGERTIALGPRLADELFQHRARTRFQGDDEPVFSHPERGSVLDHKRYAGTLRIALARAKIDRPMRPFHDGRHSSITNAAAAGLSPAALMARAGHSDFKTTQGYIDLAGETFRAEAARLEERLFGGTSTKNRYQEALASPLEGTKTPL